MDNRILDQTLSAVAVIEVTVHLNHVAQDLMLHLLPREAVPALILADQGDDEKNSSTRTAFFALG